MRSIGQKINKGKYDQKLFDQFQRKLLVNRFCIFVESPHLSVSAVSAESAETPKIYFDTFLHRSHRLY